MGNALNKGIQPDTIAALCDKGIYPCRYEVLGIDSESKAQEVLDKASYVQSIQISDQKMYQLGQHYNKHGVDMGYASKKEYEQAARNFFSEHMHDAEIFEGTFNSAHGANVGMRQIIARYDGKQLVLSKESGQIIDFYEGTSLDSFIDIERVQ